ncbi:PH domain-containing protein [Corynebacterium sp. sy039]|uniref:PH domain-containing protein n=1 Tax=Corynebacterium sp. sy039 TaxID=2599641 RepID=UPI0011B639F5|nr:PH domain-containing protein [Corynebacterium sp. sy039]QDZ42658.1 PH domain-containing protein [Corynebacterium sp. sy039]
MITAPDDNTARESLSEDQVQRYVAADAALTTSLPWELEITSKKMKFLAIVAAVVIVVIHIVLAVLVAIGDTGTTVTLIDQWGYALVGCIFAGVAFFGLRRPRVRVNADGVDVRNFIGSRFYPWSVIYGLNFPEGARIARLELPDFEYVPMWAIQSADGVESVKAVTALRELEQQYMPED